MQNFNEDITIKETLSKAVYEKSAILNQYLAYLRSGVR